MKNKLDSLISKSLETLEIELERFRNLFTEVEKKDKNSINNLFRSIKTVNSIKLKSV